MTRYFYDTEFLENGETIELISIGIVCEDGREYYDHVDTTLLPSEEVPVDPATRSTAAPGKAVVAGVEYHVHIPPHGPDDEQLIRAAVARGRGWR